MLLEVTDLQHQHRREQPPNPPGTPPGPQIPPGHPKPAPGTGGVETLREGRLKVLGGFQGFEGGLKLILVVFEESGEVQGFEGVEAFERL